MLSTQRTAVNLVVQRLTSLCGTLLLAVSVSLTAQAAQQCAPSDESAECTEQPSVDQCGWPIDSDPASTPLPAQQDRTELPIMIGSDLLELSPDQISRYQGGVKIIQGDLSLSSEHVTYNHEEGTLSLESGVTYFGPRIDIRTDSLKLNVRQQEAVIDRLFFEVKAMHARGSADKAELTINKTLKLTKGRYTTCPPGDSSWSISTKRMSLDFENGQGEAWNSWLNIKKNPILYLPYVSFPIDDRRKSGLLTPTFRSSASTGLDIKIPYYWNISPQQDMTLTPRIISKRGTMLETEHRYLTSNHEGTTLLSYLPNDNETNNGRISLGYSDQGYYGSKWRSTTHFSYLSDNDYYADFSEANAMRTLRHTERSFELQHIASWWQFTGRVQHYQTIDDTIDKRQKPYQRLPQALLSAELPTAYDWLRLTLNSEATHFSHNTNVTGQRYLLAPEANARWENPFLFLESGIKWHLTQYALDEKQPGNRSPFRQLPIVHIDSGLAMERQLQFSDDLYTHTIEPRIYYLYAPFREQDELPVFDTNALDFNFAQLFRNNRFSGQDRVGDANQLTAAVTTRLTENNSGLERLTASIGQIFYFDEHEVVLNDDENIDGGNQSDFVLSVAAQVTSEWSVYSDILWDNSRSTFAKSQVQLNYALSDNTQFFASYRQRNNSLEQVDMGFLWPLDNHWHIIGRWNYSLRERQLLNGLIGFSYQSCCWSVRLVSQNYIREQTAELESSVFLQFELTGFGNSARRFYNLLTTNRSSNLH